MEFLSLLLVKPNKMKSKDKKDITLSAEQELILLKEKHRITYITYVSMLKFYLNNLEEFSKYRISFDVNESDEEKREADTILKFGSQITKYKEDLAKLASELSPDQVKAANNEVSDAGDSDFSVESYLASKNS